MSLRRAGVIMMSSKKKRFYCVWGEKS